MVSLSTQVRWLWVLPFNNNFRSAFFDILFEEISREFSESSEDEWQRKVAAIYARNILPIKRPEFGAKLLK